MWTTSKKTPVETLLMAALAIVITVAIVGAVPIADQDPPTPEIDPRIAHAIVWQTPDGPLPYPRWSADQRRELAGAIDRAFTVRRPPTQPTGGGTLSATDAWAIYLDHVAHALRLEQERALSWSLASLTSDEMALLLDGDELFAVTDGGRYRPRASDAIYGLTPAASYRFLQSRRLIRASQLETAHAVTGWLRDNLGPRSLLPADSLDTEGERIQLGHLLVQPPPGRPGCHQVSALLAALLESVNIPVHLGESVFRTPGEEPEHHSRVELPTLGRGLVHSGDLLEPMLLSPGEAIPISELFVSLAWLRDNVDEPRPRPCDGGPCLEGPELATYNFLRRRFTLAATHLPVGLLVQRIGDGDGDGEASDFWDTLSRPSTCGSSSGRMATPVFADTEQREILERVDAEIRRHGGGDWEAGADEIERIWDDFREEN